MPGWAVTGGRISTRFALDFPEDLSDLILVSTKTEPALDIKVELRMQAAIARKET